jgi:GTPase SAR1 family protein
MFRLAQGVIIAFDLTKRETFEGVKVWADCIHKQAKDINVPKVLVGNKVDLADQGETSELRQVLRSEGQKAA